MTGKINTCKQVHHIPWLMQFLFRRQSNCIDMIVASLSAVFLMDGNWLGFLVTFFVGAPISAMGVETLAFMTHRARCGKHGDES